MPLIRAAWAVGLLIAMGAHSERAQALPAPAAGAFAAGAAGADESLLAGGDQNEAPNSIEQGQTQLPDSFDRRPIQSLLQESRFVGLQDTTFSVQVRSFYEDIDNFDRTESQAWTLGGLAGFKTGYFLDFVALGATGYTSQALDAPLDKSGTKILRDDQEAYSVIGEAYGQFRLTDEIQATAGRRGIDTPFINTQDSLMTPNTFVLYAVQGVAGSSDDAALRFGAGYVDKMKPRNSEDFESMATAAGAPAGVVRGVDVAGANYKLGAFSIGAIDYYSKDIINIAYTEIKYAIPLTNRVRLTLGFQYADQRSVGDDLLTGKSFLTDQGGLKADLAMGPVLLTAARTETAIGTRSSNGSGTDMINPWGGYPGYTAVQVEDFYRAGEDATMLRLAYNLPKATGVSVYALWVHGSTPAVAKQYAQSEYDLNLEWTPRIAALKGLRLRARYAHISQQGSSDEHQDDLRLIAYYEWR
ncbi:MAG: OprD family outer membrane porin [Steroidobacteraceae bacterium]